MNINSFLFILPRPPNLIIWDYKNHKQFELNHEFSKRLTELICDLERFDNSNTIDTQLLDAGILSRLTPAAVEWGWDELSKIFHIGTKNIPFDRAPKDIHEWSIQYLEHCKNVLAKRTSPNKTPDQLPGELIQLPKPSVMKGSLSDALTNRKTCREFSADAVSLETISTLLYLTLGYLHQRTTSIDDCIAEGLHERRTSPSGGGLNACEGFIYVQNAIDLGPGVYAYDPSTHTIRFVNSLPVEPLGELLCGQHFINNLPFGLFITSRFDKLWWKYEHSRAYRMAYVEAGHIAQTFQLVATSLGLNTWLTGALSDTQVENLLNLEDSTEQPLFFVGCGRSDGQVMCKEIKALLGEEDTE